MQDTTVPDCVVALQSKRPHLSVQVSPGDLVVTEKLRHVDVNEKIKISRVLMLGSRFESIIGRPLVPGACVTAAIEVRGLRSQYGKCRVCVSQEDRCKRTSLSPVWGRSDLAEASTLRVGAISGCQSAHL